MDKKLKAEWVKALRSGKYKQARHTLCDRDGGLCCIGVGAVACHGVKLLPGMLTGIASDKLGLTDDQVSALVKLNDGEGESFEMIAEYIEQRL